MKKILISALVIMALSGCSKEKDKVGPAITFSAPANNQTFSAGQVVNVVATVSGNVEIHEVHLLVTNNANGNEVLHFEDLADVLTYDLNKSFTAQSGIVYKIKIEAEDHSGNENEAELTVQGQ